jgi:hypothetical protein
LERFYFNYTINKNKLSRLLNSNLGTEKIVLRIKDSLKKCFISPEMLMSFGFLIMRQLSGQSQTIDYLKPGLNDKDINDLRV